MRSLKRVVLGSSEGFPSLIEIADEGKQAVNRYRLAVIDEGHRLSAVVSVDSLLDLRNRIDEILIDEANEDQQ